MVKWYQRSYSFFRVFFNYFLNKKREKAINIAQMENLKYQKLVDEILKKDTTDEIAH